MIGIRFEEGGSKDFNNRTDILNHFKPHSLEKVVPSK